MTHINNLILMMWRFWLLWLFGVNSHNVTLNNIYLLRWRLNFLQFKVEKLQNLRPKRHTNARPESIIRHGNRCLNLPIGWTGRHTMMIVPGVSYAKESWGHIWQTWKSIGNLSSINVKNTNTKTTSLLTMTRSWTRFVIQILPRSNSISILRSKQ